MTDENGFVVLFGHGSLLVGLFANVAQALIDLVLTGTDVMDHADDEPQRPQDHQGEDEHGDESEDGHAISPWLEKENGER
jgi:hypothetical protein